MSGDGATPLVRALRDKAAGRRNEVGDYWSDGICGEAADAIDSFVTALQKVAEVKCAGFGRCDMISPCGACSARRIARAALSTAPDETATVQPTEGR